jgi:drug/metabolite transporter (DMT)-like permease
MLVSPNGYVGYLEAWGKRMWMVYALCAAALWGLEYVLLGRLFDNRISPVFLLSIQMFVGALTLGSICVASGTFTSEIGAATRSWTSILLIVFSTIVFTLGSFMIAASIKEGNALLAGLIEISYPLFILVFSILLGWSEPVGLRALIGGLAILAGAAIIQSSY